MERSDVESWRRLYELAVQLRQLAPWESLSEIDIFGVRDPVSGVTGFISVMGALGEHYALSAFLGEEGITGFWDLQAPDTPYPPEHYFEIPQLQVSFEHKGELDKTDREIIKGLGFKFQGKNSWPKFRSYTPAFVPWFLDEDDKKFMEHILRQSLQVFRRLRENRSLLRTDENFTYLLRHPQVQANEIEWTDRYETVAPAGKKVASATLTETTAHEISLLKNEDYCFEIDLFMLPTHTREEEDVRPFYPYILIMVDHQSGLIVSSDMLKPYPVLRDMWESITEKVAQNIIKVGFIPQEMQLRGGTLRFLLEPLLRKLNICIAEKRVLERIDAVKDSLLESFRHN